MAKKPIQEEQFITEFEIIHAAGGIVINEKEEILMIYRLDHWDFPKGKIEPKEKTETAAIREVREETGIQKIEIKRMIMTTYHTYTLDRSEILKETRWFEMVAESGETLKPQISEGITEVIWVSKAEVAQKLQNSYQNLKDLWESFQKTKD
jgi:8-oxo-dGTP pyrophosphatase MutT (NUDIX family)